MLKYVLVIPQSMMNPTIVSPQSPIIVSPPLKTTPTIWPQQLPTNSAHFFPLHSSLEEEINRLLINESRGRDKPWGTSENADIMEEFRQNGKDFEYLSEGEDVPKPHLRRRKNKKPLPTECVFCKNNGEEAKFFKNHILKDSDDKVICPILRRYECPICHVSGDHSHTLKYCPENKNPQGIVNTLKKLRNASGKRRSK